MLGREIFQVRIATELGIPRSVIRLRTATPIRASVLCRPKVRDLRLSRLMGLKRNIAFKHDEEYRMALIMDREGDMPSFASLGESVVLKRP
jgi:hypothetical protein